MSTNAMIFAFVTLGLGIAAVALALVISIEEDIDERFYGNGKETGEGKQGEGLRGGYLTEIDIEEMEKKGRIW